MLLYSFIVALAVSSALLPLLMRMAVRLNIVDVPDERKVHRVCVPRVGGVAIAAGALLPIVMWMPLDHEVLGLVLGALVILAFGIWDDCRDLNYKIKFLGQGIAVLIAVLYGGIVIRFVPFGGLEPLSEYISVPLTVVALLGITNAINLADGLDGLAGGASLLSLGVIALLAYMGGGEPTAFITIAVMGGVVGFLRYNTYPAQVFMGDSGSQFLGFMAGTLTILLTQEVHRAVSPAIALLLLGLPVLDTLTVMAKRLYEGRSPFAPDKNHIHHKLLALGLSHYEAVFVIYLAQAALVSAAYLLRYQSDALVMSVYGLFCVAVVALFVAARIKGWYVGQRAGEGYIFVGSGILQHRSLPTRVSAVVRTLLAGSIFVGVLLVDKVPDYIAIASIGLFYFLASATIWNRSFDRAILKGGYYFLGTFLIYFFQFLDQENHGNAIYVDVFFALLAVVVAIGVRLAQRNRFEVTTLDFLVVFVAIVVPNLPGTAVETNNIGKFAAHMIVYYYGVELVFSTLLRRTDFSRAGMLLLLGLLGVKSIL